MSKQAAFWDASALVPLCVQEETSRQAHSYLRKFMPVVWWGSPVEVHSAIARLHRQGKLKDVEKQGALSRLDLLIRGWGEILPDDVEDEGQSLVIEKRGRPRAVLLSIRFSSSLSPISPGRSGNANDMMVTRVTT